MGRGVGNSLLAAPFYSDSFLCFRGQPLMERIALSLLRGLQARPRCSPLLSFLSLEGEMLSQRAHPLPGYSPLPWTSPGPPITQRNQLCPSCGCSVPQVPLPDAPQTLGPEQSRVAKLAGPEGTWKLEKELSLVHRDENVTASRGCPGRKEAEERSGSPTRRGPRRDVTPRCRP